MEQLCVVAELFRLSGRVDELATTPIRAVEVFMELLAQLGLVLGRDVLLEVELIRAVSE